MRHLLRYTLAFAMLFTIVACSSSTDPENPKPPTELKATGQVVLPAGLGTDPTIFAVICGTDSTGVATDGTFSNIVESGGPSLAILRDAAGNAVLFGFVDPNTPGANRLNSQETAVALLFFALETWGLSGDERTAIVTDLRAHPATQTLALAIETLLERDPDMLADEDSPVLPHIETAMTTIRDEAKSRQPINGQTPDKVTNSNILAEPSAAQSGVLVGPNTAQDGTGLQITNQLRRNVWYYAYKVGYEDEEGTPFDVDPPEPIRDGFLSGTGGLQSSTAILIDWATGNIDFNDKSLETPIDLQVSAGESKAFFDVVVAGAHVPGVTNTPGWYNSSDPLHAEWRTAANQMTALTFVKDVFLPVFFSIVRPLQSLSLDINPLEAASLVETLVATVPGVGQQIIDGEYLNASYTIIRSIPANADLRQALIVHIGGFIASNSTSAFDIDRALGLLTSVNLATLIVDLGLQGFDTFWVFNDMLEAHMMDRWDVTAIPVTLLLATENDVLNESEPDTRITARVPGYPENEPFCFRWSFTGEGELSDFLGQSITSGESMMTTEREVLYGIAPEQIEAGVLANIECVAYFPVTGESCSDAGGRAGEGAISISGELAGCGLHISSFRDGIYSDKLSATVSAFGCNDIEIGCLRYTLEGPGCLSLEQGDGCGGSSGQTLVTDKRIIFYEVDALVPDAVGTITVEFFDAACGEIVGSTTLDVGSIAIPHRDGEWEDPCEEGSIVTQYETAEFITTTVNVEGQIGSVVEFDIDLVIPDGTDSRSLSLFVPNFGPFDRDDIQFSSDQVSVNSVGSNSTTIFRIGEDMGWPTVFLSGYQIDISTREPSFKVFVPTDPYRNAEGDVVSCQVSSLPCCAYVYFDQIWGDILTGPMVAVQISGRRGVFEIGGNR